MTTMMLMMAILTTMMIMVGDDECGDNDDDGNGDDENDDGHNDGVLPFTSLPPVTHPWLPLTKESARLGSAGDQCTTHRLRWVSMCTTNGGEK